MEYFRDPRNQIQADIAYRLGMIANQYRTLSAPANEDFSVTLDICILQNEPSNPSGFGRSFPFFGIHNHPGWVRHDWSVLLREFSRYEEQP